MTIYRTILSLTLISSLLFLSKSQPSADQTTVSPQPSVTAATDNTAVSPLPSQIERSLEAETELFLRKLFCQGGLCSDADYAEWLIVNGESQWQVDELQMVRGVLLDTMTALDDVGLNGRTLINGYRFRRFNGLYVEDKDGIIGLVRHDSQEIILADSAFQRLKGFYIYHELGHVVDRQTKRQLSESFHHIAYGGYQVMEDASPEDWKTANGYWLRQQGRIDREEATADAFALWVSFDQTDAHKLIFAQMPRTVHYHNIVWSVNTSLTAIENEAAISYPVDPMRLP